MKCDAYRSPAAYHTSHNGPYNSSLISSASASSSSVWSDTSSQHSDDTTITIPDACDPSQLLSRASSLTSHPRLPPRSASDHAVRLSDSRSNQPASAPSNADAPAELRQNPRRTGGSASAPRKGAPPTLVRQADRKVNFVDNLVDSSTHIVEAIWPTSSVNCRNESGSGSVLPLRTFIQETLRRSRTSYSTLQVALYYLILIKSHVPSRDFAMEQPGACHANRALQCGRRMFLAALILASKYLQDRNYSARAWSKISGLNTNEINQNEIAFLIAVNWKLHITDEVYNKWTDCVMKHTPSQPPSSGDSAQRVFEKQCDEFKAIVVRLSPDLSNLDQIVAPLQSRPKPRTYPAISPGALYLAAAGDRSPASPSDPPTPIIMEPSPATVYTPGRIAPALGLLPTPRLTPPSAGYNTPAAGVATSHAMARNAMGLALAQASTTTSGQTLDRWVAPSLSSSPTSYFSARRSSLANSVSTSSSPESMVSDTSAISRSSSVSSVTSSLHNAPTSKLDVQARCRYAKQCSERVSARPTVACVPEDHEDIYLTSSPETYTGPVGKSSMGETTLEPVTRNGPEVNMFAQDSVNQAARALQQLHGRHHLHHYQSLAAPVKPVAGYKRSRPVSMENVVQDDTRDILRGSQFTGDQSWPASMAHPVPPVQQATGESQQGSRKRVCCSTEASLGYQTRMSTVHPAISASGASGMWDGILN